MFYFIKIRLLQQQSSKDLRISYVFPQRFNTVRTVREAIEDINKDAVRAGEKTHINAHEYWVGGYSYIFMSRNRVLDWDSPGFTIQASGRQTSIHPSVPKMEKIEKDMSKPQYIETVWGAGYRFSNFNL